ncbi:MAG: signal peptidase I [bacterium]|nr:signal peptidase I [bacterium]
MFRKKGPQFTKDSKFESHPYLSEVVGERAAGVIGALFELIQIAVVSLALVLLIRTFLVQPFSVKGASMEPNFLDHEYLIIDEISYRLRPPERGEIVVFRYPRNPQEFFIKRIIGLPGEALEIRDGSVFVNDVRLKEPYLEGPSAPIHQNQRVVLGAEEYFLMGDNRPASLDSRVFGPVHLEYLVGRAWIRGWPLDRVGVVESPSYAF